MTHFLATNWIWILLIGAVVLMHTSHRHGGGHMGGMGGGCGGGQMGHGHQDNESSHTAGPAEHAEPSSSTKADEVHAGDSSVPTTAATCHRGC